MISRFKAALEALITIPALLASLAEAVQEAASGPRRDDDLAQRVAALERERASVLAEAEALITRAESRFGAARASEERSRGMLKRAEALAGVEDGDEESEDPFEAYGDLFQRSYGAGGQEDGVQPVPPGVAPVSGKDLARAMKWGGF